MKSTRTSKGSEQTDRGRDLQVAPLAPGKATLSGQLPASGATSGQRGDPLPIGPMPPPATGRHDRMDALWGGAQRHDGARHDESAEAAHQDESAEAAHQDESAEAHQDESPEAAHQDESAEAHQDESAEAHQDESAEAHQDEAEAADSAREDRSRGKAAAPKPVAAPKPPPPAPAPAKPAPAKPAAAAAPAGKPSGGAKPAAGAPGTKQPAGAAGAPGTKPAAGAAGGTKQPAGAAGPGEAANAGGAGKQPAAAAPAKKTGTIARVGPPPGQARARSNGDGAQDLGARRDSGTPTPPGTGASGAGSTPPAPNLTVTTSITTGYDQLNTLSPPPFGVMQPSFEFTNIVWTVSGNSCNISAHLACHYPWGINGGTCVDVPSGSAPVVTAAAHPRSGKKVWETVVDDLMPDAASPHKSPRTYYWSAALTARHEQYHGTDDYAWVTSTGRPDAEAFLRSRTVSRASTAGDVTGVLESTRRRIVQGSDAYYGVSLPHSLRPGEIRAYADGRPLYQALADGARTHGRALEAAAAGGGGATP